MSDKTSQMEFFLNLICVIRKRNCQREKTDRSHGFFGASRKKSSKRITTRSAIRVTLDITRIGMIP